MSSWPWAFLFPEPPGALTLWVRKEKTLDHLVYVVNRSNEHVVDYALRGALLPGDSGMRLAQPSNLCSVRWFNSMFKPYVEETGDARR